MSHTPQPGDRRSPVTVIGLGAMGSALLALVEAENADTTDFVPFATGMFSASDELLTAMARAVDSGRHPPAAGPLSVHAALMDDLIDTRRARGIDAAQLARVKALVERRVADGHGGDGFSSVIDAIRRPAAAAPPAGR